MNDINEFDEYYEKIEQTIKIYFMPDKDYTHTEIINEVEAILNLPQLMALNKPENAELRRMLLEKAVSKYESETAIKAFMPEIISDKLSESNWLVQKGKVKTKYFDRYLKYLANEGFGWNTLDKIKKSTQIILSKCANPDSFNSVDSKRRGLVVGDVQSGKTANYLALINLACDYGYKLIILLAGMTDKLRVQTQQRIDEGFVGIESSTLAERPVYVGVGDNDYYANPWTNTKYDYNKVKKETQCAQRSDLKLPSILVVKKNSRVLESVVQALEADKSRDDCSLLLIDDEADNASINTKSTTNDPSTINKYIRKIFDLYPSSTYVGYTATPFANIFIDNQQGEREENENDDLFPNDFIELLDTPSNYFGYESVFNKGDVIRLIDENEEYFVPSCHKKDLKIYHLSESLIESINSFIIGNALRTLDGYKTKHRSMLVNISVYNDVHEELRYRIQDYLTYLKQIFKQDSHKTDEIFIRNIAIKKIYDLYNSDFYQSNEKCRKRPWSLIRKCILPELERMEIKTFNRKGDLDFKYDDYKDKGACIIALGGFVLSRGLTLEGLMVSYYNRNTKLYDTMMQMSRWFGYRPNYEYLCRVYMTQENCQNFADAADAIDNLKIQFSKMNGVGKSPKDFGLMVKQSPHSLENRLMITSRNKTRHSTSKTIITDYAGEVTDTSKLFDDLEHNNHNKNVVDGFISQLITEYGEPNQLKEGGKAYYERVSKQLVYYIVKNFELPYIDVKFDTESLSRFIENCEFEEWDVIFATGKSELTYKVGNSYIKAPSRSFSIDTDKILKIGKTHNRVIDPGIFGTILSPSQEKEAIAFKEEREKIKHKKQINFISSDYLNVSGRRPTLVVYPLEIKRNDDSELALKAEKDFKDILLFTIGIGFPGSSDKNTCIKYILNDKKLEEIKNHFKVDEEDMDEWEEDEYDE